jgi:hypothetical protein
MTELGPKCSLCDQPIEVRQYVVFPAEGGVVHLKCSLTLRKPPARVNPEPTSAQHCPACWEPILETDGVVKDRSMVVHTRCFTEGRPLAGGSWPLP